MNYSAIILCAGAGKRTGLSYNKMFYNIDGQTVYEKTMHVFLSDPRCKQIIVVTKKEEQDEFEKIIASSRIVFVEGGTERQDSVTNGLQAVNQDYVMVHDGARCFIKSDLLDRLCKSLEEHDACLAMVPSIDTVKHFKELYPNDDLYFLKSWKLYGSTFGFDWTLLHFKEVLLWNNRTKANLNPILDF